MTGREIKAPDAAERPLPRVKSADVEAVAGIVVAKLGATYYNKRRRKGTICHHYPNRPNGALGPRICLEPRGPYTVAACGAWRRAMNRVMTSERGGKGICLQLTKSLMMFCKFVFYILTSHLRFLVVGRTCK